MPTRNAADTRHDHEDQLVATLEPSAESGSGPSDGQPTPEPSEVPCSAEHFAGHLRETAVPLFLKASLGRVLPQVDLIAFKIYRDRLLAECGNPTDPIEIILIEQIVMAHLISGHFHVKGVNTASVESAGVYLGAAARLTGELRRTALALQVFRAAARHLTNAAGTEPGIPGELVLETQCESTEKNINIEKETDSRSDDQNERDILPLRRSATS